MSFAHGLPAAASPSRIVVLGGTGFIGSSLARRVEAEGCPTVVLGATDLDLTADDAPADLARLLRREDALVFAAAITREKGRDVGTFMRNVLMARAVVDALHVCRCAHVVYISSDAVYSDAAPNPVTESSACDPGCLYGLMHLVRERMLAAALDGTGTPLAILRPSIIFGPGDTHGSYGPNRFRRTAVRDRSIALFGEGEELRDHLFVDDFVTVLTMILWRRSHGVVNVASGISRTFREIAESVATLTDGGVSVHSVPRHVPVTHRTYDVSCLRTAFPDFSPTPFEVALARTFAEVLGSPAGRA